MARVDQRLERAEEGAAPVALGGAYSVLLFLLAVPTLIFGVYWFPLTSALNSATLLAP